MLEKRHLVKEKKTQYATTEKDILSKCNHPSIVKLFCTFRDAEYLCIRTYIPILFLMCSVEVYLCVCCIFFKFSFLLIFLLGELFVCGGAVFMTKMSAFLFYQHKNADIFVMAKLQTTNK